MTTSGISVFSKQAGDLISHAYYYVGISAQSQPLTGHQVQQAILALNLIIKDFQKQGLHLFAKERAILFLDQNKASYLLGPDGSHSCLKDDFVSTTLSVAALTGANTLTVGSTTGMLAADNIGIELDDGTRQWTTIVSVDSSTTLTITATLTDDCTIGNTIYSYTTKLGRPLRILNLERVINSGTSEIETTQFSRETYDRQVNKITAGTVSAWYYSPQNVNGELFVWQPASEIKTYLTFTYTRALDIISDSSNTLDFPDEWQLPIVLTLAYHLGLLNQLPENRLARLEKLKDEQLDSVLAWDSEQGYIQANPNGNGGGYA